MEFLVLTSEKLREAAEELEPLEDEQERVLDEIKMAWLRSTNLDDESSIVKEFSKRFS